MLCACQPFSTRHERWEFCPRGVTAQRQGKGDVEIRNYLRDLAGSRSLIFDLSVTHHRFGSSSHMQQNGLIFD
jgi:hypothetical protein